MDDKQKAFRIGSLLLDYPEKIGDLKGIKEEILSLKKHEVQNMYLKFVNYLETNNLRELCKEYVDTFDFNSQASLYITYFKLGEQSERGGALVDLKACFKKAGLVLRKNELPDYLPLLLEFASLAPSELIEDTLGRYSEEIEKLYRELERKDSYYQFIIKASLHLLGRELQQDLKGGVS